MLSRSFAIDFVQNTLQVSDVAAKLENDRLLLLKELFRNHCATIPFQNIILLAQDHATRKVPSFEKIIDDCVALRGGSCSVLNIFVNFLLQALGYDAVIQGSTMSMYPDIPNHHFVNLVRGVDDPEDLYLLDPAAWYPSYEVIPLHSITESSPVYKNAFMEYKFDKVDNTITRFTRKNTIHLFTPDEKEPDWKALYFFSLQLQDQKDLIAAIQKTYDERSSGLLSGLYFSIYPKGLAVTVNHFSLRIFNEETLAKESKEIKNADELYEALRPYWKGIDKQVIITAFSHLPPSTEQAK